MTDPRIIIALDFPTGASALQLVAHLHPDKCRLKVGKELFVHEGPRLVEKLIERGFDIFLDLKFHDIPPTVAAACRAAASLGVWMVDVHALGGKRMMEAARDALEGLPERPLLVAVTVLTSLRETDLEALGMIDKPVHQVMRLARLAHSAGLDGVVCSAQEAAILRAELGSDFLLVTPGIRSSGSIIDDQCRVMTPREAIRAGSDYLVIGRPITRAADPWVALQTLYAELN
jgi:orotidine-5'-phosphate decarboxylase